MSLDLVKIRAAVETALKSPMKSAGVDVQAYVQPSPPFPIIGVFPPQSTYVDYWQTFGPDGRADVMLELRTAVSYGAVDSMRLIDELLSVGTGQNKSIIDAVMAARTLGGVVEDCVPLTARTQPIGGENSGMFEAVIPLRIITKKEGATV